MSPSHHPHEARLLDYAAGALHGGQGLAVATHLHYCGACRDGVCDLEDLGGALLDALPGTAMAPGALEAALARLDQPPVAPAVAPPVAPSPDIPAPLRPLLSGDLDHQRWVRRLRGISELDLGVGSETTALLRIAPDRRVPIHTHRGSEMSVVLQGGYSDALGTFEVGDFVELDGNVHHAPRAHGEGSCVVLAVTTAPIRLTGPIGRWFDFLVAR